MVIFDKLQNVFIWSNYIFPKTMKLIMEAPHILRKLPIILFGKFEMFNLVSNLRIGLTQFWSPNLFNCLTRILTLPIKYERHSWNLLDKLEIPE